MCYVDAVFRGQVMRRREFISWLGAATAALSRPLAVRGQSVQASTDPRVADLVQSGALRSGVGLGSSTTATRDSATGEIKGPALELGRALAARIGIIPVIVEYP